MARNRWESVEYTLKSGTYQFKWWYSNADALDTTTLNVELVFNKISPIKIPMDVLPGEDYRFSSTELQFQYNATIESMLTDVVANSKETYLFFDIIRNGTLLWRGLVDFASIKRTDWRKSGATFSYRKMSMKINDCLWYFKINEYDLSFGTMADGYKLVFEDFFTAICDEIGMTYSSVIDTYEIESFLDDDFFDCAVIKPNLGNNIIFILKEIMLAFGVYIVFFNGKLRIMSRIDADNIISGGSTTFWNIEQDDDQNEDIEYFEITCNLDVLNPGFDNPGKMLKTSIGSEDNTPVYKTIKYKLDEGFGQFGELGTGVEETGSGNINAGGVSASSVSEYDDGDWQIVTDPDIDSGSVEDFKVVSVTNEGLNDFTSIAKPGYTIDIYDGSSNTLVEGTIIEVISSSVVKFICTDDTLTGAATWRVRKNSLKLGNYYRNMSTLLFQHIHDRYEDYIGNPVYRFTVKGIVTDPYLFITMTNNYRVRYFSLDIVNNKTLMKAHQVGMNYDFYDPDYYDPDYYE